MSRIAAVLLGAALVSAALGLEFGSGEQEQEKSSQTSAARSEEAKSCAGSNETSSGEKVRYCPARSEAAPSEKPEGQEIPIYVPPNRGSPPTRIGGSSRGGPSPMPKI